MAELLVIRTLEEVLSVLRAAASAERMKVQSGGEETIELWREGVCALLALPELWSDAGRLMEVQKQHGAAKPLLVCLGGQEELARLPLPRGPFFLSFVILPSSEQVLLAQLFCAMDLVGIALRSRRQEELAERYRYELDELIAIANVINSERDIRTLLGLILEKSRYVTGADAGSIYVVLSDPEQPARSLLRFEVAQNESVPVDFGAFSLEVSARSIVGAAALRREVINIPDLADLAQHNPWGVTHDKTFDHQTGYQTRSVLAVPLINRPGEVIGVLQLINKKPTANLPLRRPEDFEAVLPFDEHCVELCRTLASQAAISLEKALLYSELEQVFEGLVDASIQAVEARDPTTSGHSRRVAALTTALAEAVTRTREGPWAGTTFCAEDLRALHYAALLHDFGKIGVPEAVLVKARKLYEWELDLILARFDLIRQKLRADHHRRRAEIALRNGADTQRQLAALEPVLTQQEAHLDLCVAMIRQANEPAVTDREVPRMLQEIARQTYQDVRGETHPYLSPAEIACLGTTRGSLSDSELAQIRAHVVHTFNYLRTIPWGRRLSEIPRLASCHHERLDGTGYPEGKTADQIPLQARMMAIADVYDALTAADRPYKPAVSHERAMEILRREAHQGKLDSHLLRLFEQARVFEQVSSCS